MLIDIGTDGSKESANCQQSPELLFQPGAKLQQARLIEASDAVNRRRELQLLRASVEDCDPPLMVENGTRRLRGGGHPASVIV